MNVKKLLLWVESLSLSIHSTSLQVTEKYFTGCVDRKNTFLKWIDLPLIWSRQRFWGNNKLLWEIISAIQSQEEKRQLLICTLNNVSSLCLNRTNCSSLHSGSDDKCVCIVTRNQNKSRLGCRRGTLRGTGEPMQRPECVRREGKTPCVCVCVWAILKVKTRSVQHYNVLLEQVHASQL